MSAHSCQFTVLQTITQPDGTLATVLSCDCGNAVQIPGTIIGARKHPDHAAFDAQAPAPEYVPSPPAPQPDDPSYPGEPDPV